MLQKHRKRKNIVLWIFLIVQNKAAGREARMAEKICRSDSEVSATKYASLLMAY